MLDFNTPSEAIRALCHMVPNFNTEIRKGYYRVVRGPLIKKSKDGIDLDKLLLGMGKHTELHIIPVPLAAKKGGFGKIILGVAMIGLSFVPGLQGTLSFGLSGLGPGTFGPAGPVASILGKAAVSGIRSLGTSLLFSGASSLLTPQVKNNYQTGQVDQRASFLFDGAVNVAEQGGPIPIVYGTYRVGSVVVGSGLDVENV